MIPGLILVGQALEKQLTLAAVIIGWGMYVVVSGESLQQRQTSGSQRFCRAS